MRVVLLITVEIAFFMLFVAFMLTNQMGWIVAFLLFFIFLGILLKKW
jgi:hypothetical protein